MCQSHWLIFCSVNIFLPQSWHSGCSLCLQHSSISRLTNPKCFFLTETLSDFSVYWSFSFNINPSSEYSGLISFSIDWFDLLAVQGTLKSPRDSQESSPTPRFKSINSLPLSLLYGPALITIHDYWPIALLYRPLWAK